MSQLAKARKGRLRSYPYPLLFAAGIRDRPDARSSVKADSWAFSIAFGFATNKIVADDSDYLHAQQRPQDCLDLTQSSHAVRRLSAKRLGRGGTLGRPARRSSFLGVMRQPLFSG